MNSSPLCYETIGPEKALEYLNTSPGNRTSKKQAIASYAEDMRQGKWWIGCDMLIFDQKGRLRNGHHRLQAIIQSGQSAEFVVRRNVSEEEVLVLDTQQKRTLVDAAAFNADIGPVSPLDTAIINSMITCGYKIRSKTYSHNKQAEFLKEHRAAINFAKSCFYKKTEKITVAPIYAILARAYYFEGGKHHDLLKYAGRLLIDGFVQPGEEMKPGYQSILRLRDFLNKNSSTSGPMRVSLYSRAENMIFHFLRGIDRQNCTEVKEELFPIPEDTEEEVIKLNLALTDHHFLGHLAKIADSLVDEQVITPKEIAVMMMENGCQRTHVKNPEKSLSRQFADMVRGANNMLKIPGKGSFVPQNGNVNVVRVKNYVYRCEDKESEMLKRLRAS